MGPRPIIKAISLFSLLTLAANLVHAEEWILPNKTIEAKISGVYGNVVHLVSNKSTALSSLDQLDENGLDRVARYLASQPEEKSWADSSSTVAKSVHGKLQVLQEGKYVGPNQPLEKLISLIEQIEPTSIKQLIGRHPLAIRQHFLQANGAALPAKPHFTGIDKKKYNGLAPATLLVRCQVTEKGTVESFTCEPTLSAVYEAQLHADINQWLFLPAIENGQAHNQEVPVKIIF